MNDGLFNPEAFEQMPGQMSMEAVEPTFSAVPRATYEWLVRVFGAEEGTAMAADLERDWREQR